MCAAESVVQSPFLLTGAMSNSGVAHGVAVAERTGAPLLPHVQQRAVSSLICAAAAVARRGRALLPAVRSSARPLSLLAQRLMRMHGGITYS